MGAVVNRVNFIDPNNLENTFNYDGKDYHKIDIESLRKDSYIVSKVDYGDLAFHSFKISTHTPESEISPAIEIRMFEDLGLDSNREYVISYTKKELSFEDNFYINSFAVTRDLLNEKYKEIIKRVGHIDYIAIPQLVFEILYKKEFLEKKKVDLFINIDKKESFAIFYKNGEFLSSLSLPTLKSMEKRFTGVTKLNSAEISEILTTNGFIERAYKNEDKKIFDILQTLFIDIFSKINNIITNSRGKFGISGIDRIFIGVEGRRIPMINRTLELSGIKNIEVKTLDIIPNARKIHPFNAICATYAFDKLREKDNLGNLTIFPKKPPFLKTYVGKFFLINLFLIPLAVAYPIYLKFQLWDLEDKNSALQIKLNNLLRVTRTLKQNLHHSSDILANLKKEKSELDRKTEILNDTVIKLKNIKMTDQYSSMLINVNEFLQKHKLKTEIIEQSKEYRDRIAIYKMSVEVLSRSKERENIGKFMGELLFERDGETPKYSRAYTDEIKLEDNLYKSIINIEKLVTQ